MSPRRNRPARRGWLARRSPRHGGHQPMDLTRLRHGVDEVESWRGERWRVRHLTGAGTGKTYRCPGCDHEIRPGVPHVVVWPAEGGPAAGGPAAGGPAERRHWHTGCWRARDRRGPAR